jgi:asparagine synthase (glutamine-hydrolysing)
VRGVFGNIEAPALAATLYGDAQLALVDDMLHYFDRVSMAHSLEVRVPFLDHHLVEFCATVPTSLKVRGLTTKYLLKQAARGLVPDQIIDKRKIGFFHGAISQWFRVHVESAVGTYLRRPDAAYADLLDRRQVEGLIDTHAGDASGAHGRLLLAILVLEVWLSSLAERVPQHAMPAERISLPAA